MKFQFDPLPEGFVLSKPIQDGEYDPQEIYNLEKHGELIITRKRDGWKLFVAAYNKKVKIYTDGLRDVSDRLPHLIKEFNEAKLPSGTLLVGEGLIEIDGRDRREHVSSILNAQSTVEKALATQMKVGQLKFMLFDIVFWGNVPYLQKSFSNRLNMIYIHFPQPKYFPDSCWQFIIPVDALEPTISFDEAKSIVLKHQWEGLVLYDENFVSSFRLDGKNPKRPKGCYKWKPLYEGDFAIKDFFSSKTFPSKIKPGDFEKVRLLQIDSTTGKEINCGEHGVFSKKDREEIQALFRKGEPFVVQFEYEARTKNNKLVNKRFVCIRHDKKWQDCILPAKIFPKNMK